MESMNTSYANRHVKPQETRSPLHYTMYFDQDSKIVEYGKLWNKIMEQRQLEVITMDVVIGLQGVAVMVLLKDDLKDWKPTNNPYLHISPDNKYTRISQKGVDSMITTHT